MNPSGAAASSRFDDHVALSQSTKTRVARRQHAGDVFYFSQKETKFNTLLRVFVFL